MIIQNEIYCEENINKNDLYIFTIGYEHRSYYQYNEIIKNFSTIKSIVFVYDDYPKYKHTQCQIDRLEKYGIKKETVSYSDSIRVQEKILNTIKKMITQNESITVHIDYSSMPRSWYCKLPILLGNILRKNDRIYFWYSEGKYPNSYEKYPSAGIDSFSFYSGKLSMQIENNRIHVLALGLDAIRTEAIVSITDPDFLIACYAYNPNRTNLQKSIKNINQNILSRAAISIALHLDDFVFMVSKIREIANELLPTGDVILIPDGPKPLIMAISLIPDLLKKNGLTCLQVSRNNKYYKPVDVKPTGMVYGFSIKAN